MSIVSLAARRPAVSAAELLAGFVPPPHFGHCSFDNYIPSPSEPTQSAALENLREFGRARNSDVGRKGLFRRSSRVESGHTGRYLDGGFGVGKTHLLAALWHAVDGPKSFGTFVEYTNLVGALGFAQTVEELSQMRLVCIDEFELDDPGDTVLMSTLLMRLVENGVWLAATSNTLPDRLGEERFAAEDFQREIQGLAAHFQTIRIDGEDYRHRGLPVGPPAQTLDQLDGFCANLPGEAGISTVSRDKFKVLSAALTQVHPSRYGALLLGVDAVAIEDVQQITDQAEALRWVVLADRMYDRDLPVMHTGVSFDELFAPELLTGGYRKKYRRAVSRLVAMSREGSQLAGNRDE